MYMFLHTYIKLHLQVSNENIQQLPINYIKYDTTAVKIFMPICDQHYIPWKNSNYRVCAYCILFYLWSQGFKERERKCAVDNLESSENSSESYLSEWTFDPVLPGNKLWGVGFQLRRQINYTNYVSKAINFIKMFSPFPLR